MKAFLKIKYFMTISKLLSKSCWECSQYIGNDGIRNVMSRLDLNKYYKTYILRITKNTNTLVRPIKLQL